MQIIEMPDGQEVEFPEDMPDAEIGKWIRERYDTAPKPGPSAGETALDVGIAAGSGVTSGALGLAELPANLGSMGRTALEALGASPGTVDAISTGVKATPGIGNVFKASQSIRNELQDPTTAIGSGLKAYREYEPETTAGDYAKTTGEFASGIIGGPGSMGARALKYVAAPALASETAGQWAEGTSYEPLARFGAGLLGMDAGAMGINKVKEAMAVGKLEKASDVAAQGTTAFNRARKAGVYVDKAEVDSILDDLQAYMIDPDQLNYMPGVESKAAGIIDGVMDNWKAASGVDDAGRPVLTSLDDLNAVIKTLGKKAKDLRYDEKGDRRVLYGVKHFLEDRLMQLDDTKAIAQNGSVDDAVGSLQAAKQYWTKKSKLDLLDGMEAAAEDTGGAVFTQAGKENATRREFLKFLRKDANKRQTLTKEEIKAFRDVAGGERTLADKARNATRQLGRFGGSINQAIYSGGGAAGVGALAAMSGVAGPLAPAAGLALPVVGRIARSVSDRLTQSRVNDVRSLIAQGKKLPRTWKSKTGTLVTLDNLRRSSDIGRLDEYNRERNR